MELKSVDICGFRSFATPQHLSFSDFPPGLYLLRGINEVETSLDGNGSGKSSMLDAVFWAMFGRTSRGLRAGNIRNWASETCSVTLVMEEGTIVRTSSPNTLTWNDVPVDQATLETELGLWPDFVLNTAYFAQFGDFFLDASPTERMSLYSTALHLDYWDVKSDQAKQLAKTAAEGVQHLEVQVAELEATANTLRGMDFAAAIGQWDEAQAAKVNKASADIRQLDRELEGVAAQHLRATAAEAGARRDLKTHTAALAAAEQALKEARKESTKAEAEEIALTKQSTAATKEIARFKRDGHGTCAECGQDIPEDYARKHLHHLQTLERTAAAKVEHQVKLTADAMRPLRAAERRVNDLNTATPSIALLEQKTKAVGSKMEGLNQRKYQLALALAALKKEVNPFLTQRDANKRQAALVDKQAQAARKELTETRNLGARFEFWIKGFREVRYMLVQASLAHLNVEANECLHDLGLVDWELEFVVEQETKTGTVKRGFLCNVHSPYTEQAVPWEAWSGGETQRLRLAVQLGVANMLCSQLGQEFNVEFWDEPTQHLSPSGITALLTVLQERAERYSRRIFLADHRAFDFPFDAELVITKDAEGSHIGALA